MSQKTILEIINDGAIKTATLAAVGAQRAIRSASRAAPDTNLTKGDSNVGHHAIVTTGDTASEQSILEEISRRHPEAHVLTEEGGSKQFQSLVIREKDLDKLVDYPIVFGIDPIDGSSQFERGLHEWSVSVGVMRNGVHVGGAIYAPEVRGTLVVGEQSTGVFVGRSGQRKLEKCSVIDRPIRDRLVAFGPDIFFIPAFSRFVIETSKKIRTTNNAGSCALGLALVATGQLDALVEPVQCPWDWFAGWPLVEEAGGKVIFYHYGDDVPVRIDKLEPDAYSPSHRNVAFIAAGPECAEELFEELENSWGE